MLTRISFVLLLIMLMVPSASARVMLMDEQDGYELEPLFKDKDWDMSAELGMLMTSGNSDSMSFLGNINASHELYDWRFNYNLSALYKRDDKYHTEKQKEVLQTTAERYLLDLQSDYKLSETNSVFAFYSYANDRFASYTEYLMFVAGYSFTALKRSNMELHLNIGPGYARGLTSEGVLEDGLVVRASSSFKWEISDSARFIQNLSVQTANFNTQTIIENSLVTKVSSSMQMKVGFKATHNSRVNDDQEKLDTETSLTLIVNI